MSKYQIWNLISNLENKISLLKVWRIRKWKLIKIPFKNNRYKIILNRAYV